MNLNFLVELIQNAFKNILSRGFRSSLTILGLVVGIAAIVSLLSLGESLNSSISEQFQQMGTQTLMVTAGKSFAETPFVKLRTDDAEKIEQINGVEHANEIFLTTKQVEFKNQRKTVLLVGVPAEQVEGMVKVKMLDLNEGVLLSENKSAGVIIGSNVAEKSFEKQIQLNDHLEIDGKKFEVIGINKQLKNFMGSVFNSAIILNNDSLQQISSEKIYPSRISVKVLDSFSPETVKKAIEKKVKKNHNGEEDFQVMDSKQLIETMASVVGIIQLVFAGIAFIALLVGGIGIMNSMLMSVTERTSEIGIMKAIGATNSQVLSLFLAEAALIGAIGGIIGTIIGSLIAFGISIGAEIAGFPLPFVLKQEIIVGAILFAATIGIISGLIPAKIAAELDPVEAMSKK